MTPNRTALVLIGLQKDYFGPDGALRPYVEEDPTRVLANIIDLLDSLSGTDVLLVSTPLELTQDYAELLDPVGILAAIKETDALRPGGEGTARVDELARFQDRMVEIPSTGLDPFSGSELEDLLASRAIEHVVLAGAGTSVFVDCAARAGHRRGYTISVLSDCTSERTTTAQRYLCTEIFPLFADVLDWRSFLTALGLRGDGDMVAPRHRHGWTSPDELAVQAQYRIIGALHALEHELSSARQEVNESRAVMANLRQPILWDPLTGLANRDGLNRRLERAVNRGRRHGWQNAVLAIDVDVVRGVNDTFGQAVGDAVIIEVAKRVEAALRGYDTVSRPYTVAGVGGDEFLVVCEDVGTQDAAIAIAGRLRDEISAPMDLGAGSVTVTVSIGAVVRGDADDHQSLIRDAEIAMTRAKELGPNGIELFAEAMRAATTDLQRADSTLRSALEEGQLRLVYQPKIALPTGQIVGVEALLRWDHPTRGTVPPAEFMGLAEETGLIVPIGVWVLEEACRQAARWATSFQGRPPLTVSVNLPARQFNDELFHIVEVALDAAGLDPRLLCLEVTEGTVMADVATAIAMLKKLKTLGFALSVDDFGTGYSSLAYLRRLPLDEIKVDKSFVDGLGHDPESTAIVAAVVAMAHALDLVVVAEGVENENQVARLRALGCEQAQGFYFAHPQPPDVIEGLLNTEAEETWTGHEAERRGAALPTRGVYHSERVVVVDDSPEVRQLVRISLTASGFEVYEAADGKAGAALVAEVRPECVVLDVAMPEMDGYSVCRLLRAGAETANCTIVLLSGAGSSAEKAKGFLSGADDYMVKPISPRDLVSRVQTAIRRRRQASSRG